MKALFIRHLNSKLAEQTAWFLVWFSLPFSLRLNSFSLILIFFIILTTFIKKPYFPDRRKIWYLVFPIIFFLWHAKDLASFHPFIPVWKETEKMLSFLVIPVLFALTKIRRESFTKAAMYGFVSALVIGGVIMLVAGAIRFVHTGDFGEFTYHNLAAPIPTGAIYFSFYLIFALFKLDDPQWLEDRPGLKFVIAGFFIFLILLSASRLMIGIGLPLLAWHYRLIISGIWRTHKIVIVFLILLIVLGSVPFFKRAQMLIHPNLELVRSEDFRNSPEPNGLNLRLTFWKFGMEILKEHHAWFTGVGIDRSQRLLNEKIIQYGMYTGTRKGTDTGYLNYNFHNQFIETFVRVGVPGLVILFLILINFAIASGDNLFAPAVFIWIIIGFFLTESVLQRQAGIVFFCLVYSACFTGENKMIKTNGQY